MQNTFVNFCFFVINVFIMLPVATYLSPLIFSDPSLKGSTLLTELWAQLPDILILIAALVFGDFIGYWRHRLEHSKVFWPFHLIHHSDTCMTWFSLERIHPFNRLTTYAIDSLLLTLIGLPFWAIFANFTFRYFYGLLIHANLPWTYGKLGLIFVSPVMHRWHHALDKNAINVNFASVFSFYDRLFKTFYSPEHQCSKTGAFNDTPNNFLSQLGYPFKVFFKYVRKMSSTYLFNEPGNTQ